jgi:catechol 2,3-dioxygenase-like lactoylglutathione lyase family enzyme
MHPQSEGLLESSLYVDDVVRSALFYEKIFGFRVISDFGERGCAMQAGKRQVLLLFKKGGSRSIESPHDGDGELHVAFAIAASELMSWEAWLAENGISVEEKRTCRYVPRNLRAKLRESEVDLYLDALNRELVDRLQRGGETFVSNAVVGGHYVLRACIVNFHTTQTDVEAVPDIVTRIGREVQAELRLTNSQPE